jgi:hypothetical protein
MITVQTAIKMNHLKISLINRRDLLFEEYLDNLSKYEKWRDNIKEKVLCHGKANKGGEQMLKILRDNLRNTSRKLRVLDAQITGIKKLYPDNLHTILEIN